MMKFKNNIFLKVLPVLLMTLTTWVNTAKAQMCGYVSGQGCSNTDYNNSFLNSTSNASTIEYDNFVSGLHSTVIRNSNGGFKIWGWDMANNGTSDVLSPTNLNSTNYPALGSATVYKVTIGSYQYMENDESWTTNGQSIALASNGLYAWGTEGTVLDATITSSAAFQKITIAGKTDGLPTGVTPQDVKMMTATGGTVSSPTSNRLGTLIIVTCSGDVWVLSRNAQTRGNGSTGSSTGWSRVEISAGNYLTGIVSARTEGGAVIALKSDGTLWTWGLNTYLGDNSATISRTRATQMTLPSSGTVKMIGITEGSISLSVYSHTYYVLMTDGNLWALGGNYNKQIGDWTTTERQIWTQPRYDSVSGAVMNNIAWIAPQENTFSPGAINVLTNTGQLYAWGVTVEGMIGTGLNTSTNPTRPTGINASDRILAVETGGKHSMVIKSCTSTFGFVGVFQYGSMGNGSATNPIFPIQYPYSFNTASLEMCAAETTATITTTPANTTIGCSNSTIQLVGFPSGGDWSVSSGSATVNSSGLVTLPSSGNSVINYSTPSQCATITLTANHVNPGVIASNQTVASGGNPSAFTVTTTATGSGTLSYQWQSSLDGGTTWINISGATSSIYDAPAGITTTTQYRRAVTSTLSGFACINYSNVVTVTVTCIANTAAPNLNNTSAYTNGTGYYQIPCGSTTANLSALTASNRPSGSVITWHTGSVATTANRISPANALTGTNKYYAAFYNSSGNCYSPTKMVTVAAPICAVNDDFTSNPITAGVGGIAGNIYNNDTYNGVIISTLPANSVDFSYELWPTLGVTVDANGNLIIPASMPAGDYTAYLYKICDKDQDVVASTNCSSAEIKFKVVPPPFGCNNNIYLSQTNTLYLVDTTTNPLGYQSYGTSSVNYNAIGFNPLDGRIYAMKYESSTIDVLIINPDGSSTNLGPITGLPVTVYAAGEIDDAGNYYVRPNGTSNKMYKINLATKTATLITLSESNQTADFCYSVSTGLLYGIRFSNGQVVSIDPNTGTVTGIGIIPGSAQFGAMFASSTGEIYGANNAGGFYQFNKVTGERILISASPPSMLNDGAHCVTAPITFSADLEITKTNGTIQYTPGSTTTYTVTVKNNGPFGVLNAQVSDLVPVGIPAANVSYTAVASTGSLTNVSGTQTGAINDLVGLPINGTVTYTVVVNIPTTFTGNLVNTATVTPPLNITDSNTANNTATDTDTSGACYKPGITTGTALDTKHGISSLGRAGADNGNWPMVRKGAWTALEAKTKGFVINRIATTAQVNAIPNPVEGMMVYDEEVDCLKIYTTTDLGATFAWKCFNTQTCAP